MRVAVCFSGFLRNYKHTLPKFKQHFFDSWHPDVFFWGYPNREGLKTCQDEFPALVEPTRYVLRDYTEELRLSLYQQHRGDRFHGRKRNETNVDGLLSQYNGVYQCNLLKSAYEKENNFKYDVVVKARWDVFFHRSVTPQEMNMARQGYMLSPSEWDFKEVSPYGMTDVFAMSSSEKMDQYSSIINRLGEYFDEGCLFHHESLTGYHALKCKFDRQPIVPPHFWFEYPDDVVADVRNRRDY